jgi:hypothetical protein
MPLSWTEIRDRAIAFSKEWESEFSEDAEAKSFMDGFFEVFGVPRRRVASFEKKTDLPGDRSGFIDLLWKGVLLIEFKSRGKDLDRAYKQAKSYFPGIKDYDLPQRILVCDFERFRLYDLESDESIEFQLKDLHKFVKAFGFMAGYQTKKIVPEDPVNVEAAERMGKLHDALMDSGYQGHALEVYLVRILFCLFAEDTGIFEKRMFQDYLEQRTSEDGNDLGARLVQLFHVLNTPENKRGANLDDQLREFRYVNGGLFQENLPPADFNRKMREILLQCCGVDWSKISPAIFGSLFQSVMDPEARRNLGAHYTSESNIKKVIHPLFLDDLRAQFKKASESIKSLTKFQEHLATLKFLDPACGCGNFLVITYRELRKLELEVLQEIYREKIKKQMRFLDIDLLIKVNVNQFYGIEIEEFPARIAEVALWLVDHQMNNLVSETLGERYVRLPLTTSPNIVIGNALRLKWEENIAPKDLSYILGNPPFLGHHLQSDEQKADLRHVYGDDDKAGVMDFVSAWYCKAASYIKNTPIKVAFVSTNSISQGEQVGILWRNLAKRTQLYIHFAHRTFKWSNEAKGKAAVYCVIIGFGTEKPTKPILFDYESPSSEPMLVAASQINAYLTDAAWILIDNQSKNLYGMPEMMYGSKPTDNGHFLFTDEEKVEFLKAEPGAKPYIKPFMSNKEYLYGKKRWVLWLVGADPGQIKKLPSIMERVKLVEKFRKASTAESTRNYPHHTLFRQVTQPDSEYILIPRHTSETRKYIPFGFFGPECIVADSCNSLPKATLYHFGVIQSEMHFAWVRAVCGRLENRYRYSKDIVYNNYPWPEGPTPAQKKAIEAAAQGVLEARALYPDSSPADLYDPYAMPVELVKAHAVLDKAVDAAYGKKFNTEAERISYLFELYQKAISPMKFDEPKTKRKKKTTV